MEVETQRTLGETQGKDSLKIWIKKQKRIKHLSRRLERLLGAKRQKKPLYSTGLESLPVLHWKNVAKHCQRFLVLFMEMR